MGAAQSDLEKQLQEQDYAFQFGEDESEKKCPVFRSKDAIDQGHLIDRDNVEVHSLYQHFK